MRTHLTRLAAAMTLILLLTLLPFLPGRYDSLAAPLSLMSQLLGMTGLSLVPIGAAWLVCVRAGRLAGKRHLFALAALIASCFLALVVVLGAFVSGGLLFGLGWLALLAGMALRVVPRVTTGARATEGRALAIALYLIVLPIAVLSLQLALLGPAAEFSRSRAIRNSAALISDIERYRAAHGSYPPSLQALWPDYRPAVVGIQKYDYEPNGDAYNLFFEQPAIPLGTREIVMYNPRDQHAFTSHVAHRLRHPPEELPRIRGYYAVHDGPHPHWKYFWFD